MDDDYKVYDYFSFTLISSGDFALNSAAANVLSVMAVARDTPRSA